MIFIKASSVYKTQTPWIVNQNTGGSQKTLLQEQYSLLCILLVWKFYVIIMAFYGADLGSYVDSYSTDVYKRTSPRRARAFSSRYQPYSSYGARTSPPEVTYPHMNNNIVTGRFNQSNTNYDMSPYSNVPTMLTGWQNADATRALLANAFVYQDATATQNVDIQQHLHALRCLQDITGNDVRGHNGTVSKEENHPFYWRRRSPPVEGRTRTRDKYRVVYTEKQRLGLEKAYENNKFITTQKKTELAKDLALSDRQVI